MPPLRAPMTKCTMFFVSHQFNAVIAHSNMNLRLIPPTIAEARTKNNHPESGLIDSLTKAYRTAMLHLKHNTRVKSPNEKFRASPVIKARK